MVKALFTTCPSDAVFWVVLVAECWLEFPGDDVIYTVGSQNVDVNIIAESEAATALANKCFPEKAGITINGRTPPVYIKDAEQIHVDFSPSCQCVQRSGPECVGEVFMRAQQKLWWKNKIISRLRKLK
jgi:hypothetical protein